MRERYSQAGGHWAAGGRSGLYADRQSEVELERISDSRLMPRRIKGTSASDEHICVIFVLSTRSV